MNIYTHSNRRAKRTSVEILDDLSTSIPSENKGNYKGK